MRPDIGDKRFDYDHQWAAQRLLYAPFLSREPYVFTASFISSVHDALMFKNKNKFATDLPPDWLFVNRLQAGLFSVLQHLGARVCWGDVLREGLAD